MQTCKSAKLLFRGVSTFFYSKKPFNRRKNRNRVEGVKTLF